MNRRQFFRHSSFVAGGAAALSGVGSAAAAPPARAILFNGRAPDSEKQWLRQIGFRKQLLADDYVIAERMNVTRELGQVKKADRPIFENCWDISTVMHDGDRFKMWYIPKDQDPKAYISGGPGLKSAFAVSADGFNWTKKFDLSTNTFGAAVQSILLDTRETDPAHRYKATYHPIKQPYGVCLAHSPDGFRWAPYNDGRPVTYRAADTNNQIFWDEGAGVYRLFTRTDFGTPGGETEIRGTRVMVNPDVRGNPTDWTTARSWQFDREGLEEYKRRQIYAFTNWIYEGVHFGLVTAYEWPGFNNPSEGPYDIVRRHERDVMNFYIAPSRDADDWDLHWIYAGRPMIPRGPAGSFDKDQIYQYSTVITHADKHWFYYSGGRERHNAGYAAAPASEGFAASLATLRLDGMVCLEAKDRAGTVTTRPFRLEGSKLEINVDAGKGEAAVEVLDAAQTGIPLPGFTKSEATPYRGVDELRLRPRWDKQADLSAIKGRTVRLKFHLHNAKLYSFQVRP